MYGKVCGEKIKKAIKETGLTQEKFAKKINTGRSMISQWIIGKRNPSLKSLEKIAIVTKKPLSYFFLEESPYYQYVGNKNRNVSQIINDVNLKKENELLKKDIEILKLQMELLKKDKK